MATRLRLTDISRETAAGCTKELHGKPAVRLSTPLAIQRHLSLRFALRMCGTSSFFIHDIVRESSSLSTLHFAQLSSQVGQGCVFFFSLFDLSI